MSKKNKTQELAERQDKASFIKKAIDFASKLARRDIYNPSKSTQKGSTSFSLYTKEQILGWLRAPTANAANLRKVSAAMYLSSPRYSQLINHRASTWMFDYTIIPAALDEENMDIEAFKKQYQKILQQTENWNIPHEMRKVVLSALKDGIFFGVSWKTNDSFFIQKIDPSICSVCSVMDGTYLFDVDMSKIKEEELEFYPPEFTSMHEAYKKGGTKQQQVPPEISWCLPADETDVNAFVPPYAGVLPELLDIEQYRSIQQSVAELSNYKVLVGRMDTDEHGTPVMDDKLSWQYYQHLCNALPPQVGAAILPFKVEAFNFDQSKEVANVDIVTRSAEQFWNASGTSAVLHGGEITTSGGLQLVTDTESNLLRGMLLSVERLLNRHMKHISGTYKFKIKLLPTTVYNNAEVSKIYKESATYGVAPSMYFASLGMRPGDIAGLNVVETNIINVSRLEPLKSSHTMTSEEQGETGRPALEETQLTDEGARSRDK